MELKTMQIHIIGSKAVQKAIKKSIKDNTGIDVNKVNKNAVKSNKKS